MNIWLVLIAVMVLSAIVQQTLQRKFRKYSEVSVHLSGAEVAAKMLRDHGIGDVKVMSISGGICLSGTSAGNSTVIFTLSV